MSGSVIKIDNVSKLYKLGEIGTGTISHDLNRFYAKIRGKEDPFQKVGQVNDRSAKAIKDEIVYALRDISFDVKQGEVLGIIGKNGAGKSTLLKLLSRVTTPTSGNIKIKGRLASLLEVGTGFHPEMTGRENIYMNGTIMGMRRWEIQKKLDEIVDFAGVAKYLDTPTKRYSSGMTVRLGFAIAAFLEPEILVVDEVLAVGDAEFQKKAIGKMQDVSEGEGRTVLFVSHNMGSISKLCHRTIVLQNGNVTMDGSTEEAIDYYLNDSYLDSPIIDFKASQNVFNRAGRRDYSELNKFALLNHFEKPGLELFFGQPCKFLISFEAKTSIAKVEIGIGIKNSLGINLGGFVSNWNGFEQKIDKGEHEVEVTLPFMYLMPGQYLATVWIKEQGQGVDDQVVNCLSFTVIEANMNGNKANLNEYRHLNIAIQTNWNKIK